MASYEFQKKDDSTIFMVTPDLNQVSIFMPIFGVTFFLLISIFLFLAKQNALGILLLIFTALIPYMHSRKKTLGNRFQHEFSVNKSGIVKDGNLVPSDRIHRLIIRNPISKIERPYGVGVAGAFGIGAGVTGVIGGSNAALGQLGNKIERKRLDKLESISYELHVEAGGKATKIAHGLDEVCANGLLEDTMRTLN